jgi:predicted dehydrogenase
MTYNVAIIGTGPDPDERDRDGYAMAYRHAPGYTRLDNCDLMACADIVEENVEAFADQFGIIHVYTDHQKMLKECDIDIVSVCVPPQAHADIVTDCATLGDLEAIHCEKPMATTWADCQEMVEVCEQHDVQLTIDHQRRLAKPAQEAKRMLDEGKIGDLRRVEWSELNLFDAGSHLFDLCDFMTDGTTPKWVLAGIDTDPDNEWFGALNEVQAIAQWGYRDGTQGVASTGEGDRPTFVDAYLRLVGEDGEIEIQPDDGPPLRVRTDGGWKSVDTDNETIFKPRLSLSETAVNKVTAKIPLVSKQYENPPNHYERAIEHVVTSLEEGTEPVFAGSTVLRGTELVFACWESARRRERIELPLDVDGNPLEAIIEEQESSSASPTAEAIESSKSSVRTMMETLKNKRSGQ